MAYRQLRGMGGAALAVTAALGVWPTLASGRVHLAPGPRMQAQVATTTARRTAKPQRLPAPRPTDHGLSRRKARANRADRAYRHRHRRRRTRPAARSAQAVSAVFGGLNRPGLTAADEGAGGTPPDPTGAVGPHHYVELVNSMVAVYDRETLASPPVARTDETAFFGASPSPCDGHVQWDQAGQRWLYSAIDCFVARTSNTLYFGWSKTPDPTDLGHGWCRYSLSTGTSFYDFPALGHDDQHIIIGATGFANSVGPVGALPQPRVFVFPKPAPGDATCPTTAPVAATFDPAGFGTLAPANLGDSSATGYVVAAARGNAGILLRLLEISGSAGSPQVTVDPDVTVPGFSVPPAVPQPGTQDTVDSGDARLTNAVGQTDPTLGSEAIWTQHTVGGSPAGSAVRWYELRPGVPRPVQVGSIQPPGGGFAFNGAISPTARGVGAAVFYNVGGPSQVVDLRVQVRSPALAPGTMGRETVLSTSAAIDQDFSCTSQGGGTSCRWGDFAGASPDPTLPDVVWGTGQITGPVSAGTGQNNAQWQTQNAAATAEGPPLASFRFSPSSPVSGSVVRFDGSPSWDPDGTVVGYRWDFGDGSSATGPSAGHAFAPGRFSVTLAATDDSGNTGSSTRTVTVAAPPPPPVKLPQMTPPPPQRSAALPAPRALSLRLPRILPLAGLTGRGVRIAVRCPHFCRFTLSLVISAAQARRLGVRRRVSVEIATGRGRGGPGIVRVRLRPARRWRRRLSRAHSLRATLVLTRTEPGPPSVLRRSVTFTVR